ncbi:helix-turn-helix domain-containing protein [Plantactinospora solaniradicis]|uniref:Helix-turn-helix domain-containing protein n=1 Tax=Plantactinospora solaniradicis TaxID=1723736 RepID=A0ABW1K296_9ACTN
MPAAQPSPILRRRRLGVELRKLRESAKLTGDQVIEAVGWASASKLSRLENGRSRPDLRDVLDLLDLYKVTGPLRDELTAITGEAGDIRSWLRSYPVMTPRQRGYAELEAGCAEIREYSPVIVPGLLQTKAYVKLRILSSRQLVNDPDRDDTEDTDTEVAARLARQSLLTRDVEPPHYSAVIEEAALGVRAGPRDVVRAQLIQLRKLAMLPNVTLQVLLAEQTIADWYLPHTAFSLYRFAEPQDPETLAIEGLSTNLMLTDQDEISTYSVVFEWLQDSALSPEETLSWLADEAGQRAGPIRNSAARGSAVPPAQRSRRTGRLTEQ